MTQSIQLAMVQHPCHEDAEHNLAYVCEQIQHAAAQGANLVLLQELHTRPYFCQTQDSVYFDWAETIPGPSTDILSELAARLQLVIVTSLFEKRAPGLYHNTAVVLDSDGKIAGLYRKMHIPDDPGYNEKYYFTPGEQGFKPIETTLGKIGVLVCWDQWFPEAARILALSGAQIIVIPTAIGWDPRDPQTLMNQQLDAWITTHRGHAISNGIAIAACNRVGHEPDPSSRSEGITFWGNSLVVGQFGELLNQYPSDAAATQLTAINTAYTEEIRRQWPFLRDRRIDAYKGILNRYSNEHEPNC